MLFSAHPGALPGEPAEVEVRDRYPGDRICTLSVLRLCGSPTRPFYFHKLIELACCKPGKRLAFVLCQYISILLQRIEFRKASWKRCGGLTKRASNTSMHLPCATVSKSEWNKSYSRLNHLVGVFPCLLLLPKSPVNISLDPSPHGHPLLVSRQSACIVSTGQAKSQRSSGL